jgi:hypothetical protein
VKTVWRAAAVPLKGETVACAMLKVRSFSDEDAHIVSSGLVTEQMLKGYLKNGDLSYRFRGSIFFPQPGKTAWKAGSLTLTGSYDAAGDKVSVNGLPKPAGLVGQPDVYIALRDVPTIRLVYPRRDARMLEFTGDIEGVDAKTGELLVRFTVKSPEVLLEQALLDFLADENTTGAITTFKLTCTPVGGRVAPKALTFVIGRDVEKDWNTIQIDGWEKEPLAAWETGSHETEKNYELRTTMKTGAGSFVRLTFEFDRAAFKDGFGWWPRNNLLSALYTGKFKGSVYVSDGKEFKKVATFTTAYGSTTFKRREPADTQ